MPLNLLPVMSIIKEWLGSKVSRTEDTTSLLRQYSQSITHILDFRLLATVAVGTACELMEITRGYLFLVERGNDESGQKFFQLRGVKGMGSADPESAKLQEGSALAKYFCQQYKPLVSSDLELKTEFNELSPDERRWLENLDAGVFVPIHAKDDWIGLIVLGPKTSGSSFTARECAFLNTMADQTAVALQNTRLVEDLLKLNDEFREINNALDQANRHLERLDQARTDFIAIASHELRTPLNLINSASQMLMDDPELQKETYYQELLSRMNAGSVRLQEILDSMMDMANIDTHTLKLEPQPVSMQSLIRIVCDELSIETNKRKQAITLKDLHNLPLIQGDAPALKKVFYNLIINAIKYTPDGGKIMISGSELKPEFPDLPNGGVEVLVSDTGIGIDPHLQELIFVKFYQTNESAFHSSGRTKFKGGGSGLGLAIARGIVEAHQGKIWVDSAGYDEANCPGSIFHVVLPLSQFRDMYSKASE